MAHVAYPGAVHTGRLQRRYKRFFVDVVLDGDDAPICAHTPNTGGMTGLLDPGNRVLLTLRTTPGRKLPWALEAIYARTSWVGTNPLLSNRLVEEAALEGLIGELDGYRHVRREAPFHPGERSRVDLLFSDHIDGAPPAYVEVKSATLREGACALWPDAKSERGRRHIESLSALIDRGFRAVVVFVVQRTDCDSFAPAGQIDPASAEAMYDAYERGLDIVALEADVMVNGKEGPGLYVTRRLPVAFRSTRPVPAGGV